MLPLCAKSDESRDEKIRNILENTSDSYQKELPKQRLRKEVKEVKERPRRSRKQRPAPNLSFNTSGGAALVQVMMYIVGFVLVVLFILWLVNRIRNRERTASDKNNKVNRISSGDDDEPDYDISEADALAQKGELTEAIHRLYLEVISWLQKRGSLKIKRSLTNREILRASALSINKTRTLGAFIGLVEDLYFGDFTATQRDYEQSKEYAEEIMRRSNG